METFRTVAEGTHTRRELIDEVAASRVMVGRILHNFGQRGWIDRRGTGGDDVTETQT